MSGVGTGDAHDACDAADAGVDVGHNSKAGAEETRTRASTSESTAAEATVDICTTEPATPACEWVAVSEHVVPVANSSGEDDLGVAIHARAAGELVHELCTSWLQKSASTSSSSADAATSKGEGEGEEGSSSKTPATTATGQALVALRGPLSLQQLRDIRSEGGAHSSHDNASLLQSRRVCQPQPVPSLLLGYEDSRISTSPYVVPCWEKMSLEPYSAPRNVRYIALVPDNAFLIAHTAAFLRDVACSYLVCLS